MARRLNKKMVVGLTVAGMVVTTAGGILMVTTLPKRDPGPIVTQAEECAGRGEYAEASQYYIRAAGRSLAAARPENETNGYLILAGDMALKAGKAREAYEAYTRVTLNDPHNEEAHERIVKLRLEMATLEEGGDWSRLQRDAENLCAINPSNFIGVHALGLALIRQGAVDETNLQKGEEKLKQAVEGDKSNPEYARSLMEYYFEQNRPDDAEYVCDVLIKSNLPEDPKQAAAAYRLRGEFYIDKKLWLLRHTRRDADPAELAQKVTEADTKALADLEKAVECSPKDIDVLLSLGWFWQSNRPTAPDPAAKETEAAGFRAKAKELYERAIQTDPDDFKGYLRLAMLYSFEGKYDDALKVLKERLDRGYPREHYLVRMNRAYMARLREEAFKINVAKASVLQAGGKDQDQYDQRHQAIMDALDRLYKETAADTPGGENDPLALFMQGRLLALKDDLNRAQLALEQADKQAAGVYPDVKRTLADIYLRTNQPGAAREALQAVLKAYPDDAMAMGMLAVVYAQSRDPHDVEEAVATAQRALDLSERNTFALQALRTAYMKQGNLEGVAWARRQLTGKEDPILDKLNQALLARAQAEQDPAQLAKAEKLLREILAEDPLNLSALRQLVQTLANPPGELVLSEEQKREKAAQVQKLLDEKKALALRKAEEPPTDTQPAEDHKKEYMRIADNIDRLRIFADTNATDKEKAERMEELVKRGDDPYVIALQLYELHRLQGDIKGAIDYLKQAHALKPDEPNLVQTLFNIALADKDWALAEECIGKAIALGAVRAGGHFLRGQLLLNRAENEEDLAAAERELRVGLSQFPNYTDGHVYLGNALLRMNKNDAAKRAFLEAMRLNPDSGRAALGLALLASVRGDEAEKQSYLKICNRLIPGHPWVRAQLGLLEDERDPAGRIPAREASRKANPADIDNLTALAGLYLKVGQPDKAAAIYGECRKLKPDDLSILQNYAALLRTTDPKQAEAMLRQVIQEVDPKDQDKKATMQLVLASHLWAVAGSGGAETTKEQWDGVDAAHVAAASISATPTVCAAIGAYFVRTSDRPHDERSRRYREGETWYRKAVAAAQTGGDVEAQEWPRHRLIDAMLQAMDSDRFDDIQKEINEYRQHFPDSPVAALLQGRLQALRGRDQEAIASFTDYLQKVPEGALGYYRRGMIYLRRNQWEEAIKDLKEVKRLDPSFSDYIGRTQLAYALESSGQVNGAIDELRSILEENSQLISVVQRLLGIYASLKNWSAAESLIAPRAEAQPDNPIWPRFRAQLASEQNQPEPAIRFAREAVEKSKFDPDEVDYLLTRYLQFGQYDQLISFVKDQLPADRQSALVRLRVGGACMGKQDVDQAIDWYVRAPEAGQISLEAFWGVFSQDLRPPLNIDAALETARKKIQASPDHRIPQAIVAVLQQKKGGDEALVQSLRDALEALPAEDNPANKQDRAFLMRQIATSLQMKKQMDEAKKWYEKALELAPDDVPSLNNLAYLLMVDMKDPASAQHYAERAAELAPNNPGVVDTLGWNLVLLKKCDDGIATLRQAVDLTAQTMAQSASILDALHYHLAEAFFRRSQTEGANRDADLGEARTECKRSHELIMKAGRDREGILDDLVALGEKLGLTLGKEFPTK